MSELRDQLNTHAVRLFEVLAHVSTAAYSVRGFMNEVAKLQADLDAALALRDAAIRELAEARAILRQIADADTSPTSSIAAAYLEKDNEQ